MSIRFHRKAFRAIKNCWRILEDFHSQENILACLRGLVVLKLKMTESEIRQSQTSFLSLAEKLEPWCVACTMTRNQTRERQKKTQKGKQKEKTKENKEETKQRRENKQKKEKKWKKRQQNFKKGKKRGN